jgi:predicted amidohydrolase YtcJ
VQKKQPPTPMPDFLAPDMIIMKGKVITVDDDFSYAEAIAVKDGKIVAVGTNPEISPLRGANTRVLDLKGATLLPGINDSHVHLPWYVVSKPPYKLDLSYPNVKSIADIRNLLKAAAAAAKPGDWILGEGWNEGFIADLKENPKRQLTKADLDDVAPDNPVYFIEFSFHNAWVNSKALAMAGITRDTASPEGGSIVRNQSTGEAVGFLCEKARNLIEAVKPVLSREQLKHALLTNVKYLSELGITSLTSASELPMEVNIYSEIAAAGNYPVRLNLMLMWAEYGLGGTLADLKAAMKYVGTTTGFGNEWLKIGGIKIFADGVPHARTAWVYDAYPDGSHGALVVPGKSDAERQTHLNDMIRYCHGMGYQIAVHACGDRTIDAAVDAFVSAMKEKPWDARHYTVHGDWIPQATMKAMGKWRIGHATQSVIKHSISDTIDDFVGKERSGDQMPLKSLLDAGVMVANSSDAPCAPPDWRIGMQYSVLRESKGSGAVSGPHQCLTVPEAIRTYTILPAWLEHAEHVKGSIEKGKYADFCILGKDITAIDPHEIMDTPILMTIVGGKVVHSNGTLTLKGGTSS